MISALFTVSGASLQAMQFSQPFEALSALESGRVVYLPQYAFALDQTEQCLLTPAILSGARKNVSYDYQRTKLGGYHEDSGLKSVIQAMMHRYALFAHDVVTSLLPSYQDALIWGRTSYRPAEVNGRVSSKRKDDTRLHVDAFPSTPVNGLRILRVFCNINPHQEPRVWQVGQPFSTVLTRFSKQLPRYRKSKAQFLHLVKATKTLRSPYDHYMLHLHDSMKLDDDYQQHVEKETVHFPSSSTWMVFTDQVSHAALSGQYLLEQTFYLPLDAMLCPEKSPLSQLSAIGFLSGRC